MRRSTRAGPSSTSRALACRAWRDALLQLDEEDSAGRGAGGPRPTAWRPPQERPRKPLPGMMLHQDGSTHAWVPGCQWDLIVTLDDATTEIYSAFFVEEEGTMSSLRGLREVIETKGLFSSLYTDRGSHYWYTEAAGGHRRQEPADAGAPRLAPVGGHPHSGLFAGSAGPLGARLPHPARSAAQRIGAAPGSRRWWRPTGI